MSAPSILREAEALINGDRRKDYGGPLESFNRLAALWNAYLNHRPVGATPGLAAEDVANLLILLKVARAMNGFHRDSYVDIAGYAGCVEMIARERA